MHGLEVPDAPAGRRGRGTAGSRRTGCCRADGRRSSRVRSCWSAGRRAQLLVRAHRRPHGDLAGVRTTSRSPRSRRRTRPAAARSGMSTAPCRCARRTRESSPGICSFLITSDEIDAGVIDDVADDERRRLHRVGERVQIVALAALRARQPVHQIDAAVDAEARRRDDRSWRRPRSDSRRRCPSRSALRLPSVQYADAALVPPQRSSSSCRLRSSSGCRSSAWRRSWRRGRADRERRVEVEGAAHHERRRLEVVDERRLRRRASASGSSRFSSAKICGGAGGPLGAVRQRHAQNGVGRLHAPRHAEAREVAARRSGRAASISCWPRSPP